MVVRLLTKPVNDGDMFSISSLVEEPLRELYIMCGNPIALIVLEIHSRHWLLSYHSILVSVVSLFIASASCENVFTQDKSW